MKPPVKPNHTAKLIQTASRQPVRTAPPVYRPNPVPKVLQLKPRPGVPPARLSQTIQRSWLWGAGRGAAMAVGAAAVARGATVAEAANEAMAAAEGLMAAGRGAGGGRGSAPATAGRGGPPAVNPWAAALAAGLPVAAAPPAAAARPVRGPAAAARRAGSRAAAAAAAATVISGVGSDHGDVSDHGGGGGGGDPGDGRRRSLRKIAKRQRSALENAAAGPEPKSKRLAEKRGSHAAPRPSLTPTVDKNGKPIWDGSRQGLRWSPEVIAGMRRTKDSAGCQINRSDSCTGKAESIDHITSFAELQTEIARYMICDGQNHWVVSYQEEVEASYNNIANLRWSCKSCNSKKSGKKGVYENQPKYMEPCLAKDKCAYAEPVLVG